MKVVSSLPRPVREVENLWIRMADGCRLAARLWLPGDAAADPVPAIIEYIPYRKRDGTRWRDEPMHRYFAGHGHAVLRVDLRGSGESDGILLDEYLPIEQDDAVEVIRWAASQPWCTGAVGMMGKSWGGFNALQVAARRPPELRAIITVCSTDDRYADDAHYMGGCLLNENVVWGSSLFTLNARPPDPALVGDRWRDLWRERLESDVPFAAKWLEHPLRDDYWKQGSVCEDFSLIECPVYAIGGWADAYTNAIPRLLAGLRCPRKGLVGPWGHLYPHEGVPGPAIGFLQEALRWWDFWLKGIDTGVLDEPAYRVWMEEWTPPDPAARSRPGRWVAEASWPSERIRPRTLILGAGRLAEEPGAGARRLEWLEHLTPQTVGITAPSWCSFGQPGELPADQREDDERSLVFDSPPLEERLELLGAPVVRLRLRVDRPRAFVAARLSDVAPDGRSLRVSYGLLDLTHGRGHERAELIAPGSAREVRLELNDLAYSFAPGHRIRLSLSTAYWPVAWPSPQPVRLSVAAGESSLELPVRPPREEDRQLRAFDAPEAAPPLDAVDLAPGGIRRTLERDAATGETAYTITRDLSSRGDVALSRVHPIELDVGHGVVERFRITDGDPLSAATEVRHTVVSRRDDWSIRIETMTRLTSSREAFRIEALLEAWEGEQRVFSRSWDRSVPRFEP